MLVATTDCSEEGAMPYTTEKYEGMIAETMTMQGHKGDTIHAYIARPLGLGPFPGLALVTHGLGWTEWYKEFARKFAHHGYVAIVPDILCRVGDGTPEDVLAKSRAEGGLPDDQVVGDMASAGKSLRALPHPHRQGGILGSCSGGGHTYLTPCPTHGGFY